MTAAALTRAQHDAVRMRWTARAIAVALVAAGVVFFYVVSEHRAVQSIQRAQRAACERGNVLREQVADTDRVIAQLLAEVTRNREVAARSAANPARDLRAASDYRRLRRELRPVVRANCANLSPP